MATMDNIAAILQLLKNKQVNNSDSENYSADNEDKLQPSASGGASTAKAYAPTSEVNSQVIKPSTSGAEPSINTLISSGDATTSPNNSNYISSDAANQVASKVNSVPNSNNALLNAPLGNDTNALAASGNYDASKLASTSNYSDYIRNDNGNSNDYPADKSTTPYQNMNLLDTQGELTASKQPSSTVQGSIYSPTDNKQSTPQTDYYNSPPQFQKLSRGKAILAGLLNGISKAGPNANLAQLIGAAGGGAAGGAISPQGASVVQFQNKVQQYQARQQANIQLQTQLAEYQNLLEKSGIDRADIQLKLAEAASKPLELQLKLAELQRSLRNDEITHQYHNDTLNVRREANENTNNFRNTRQAETNRHNQVTEQNQANRTSNNNAALNDESANSPEVSAVAKTRQQIEQEVFNDYKQKGLVTGMDDITYNRGLKSQFDKEVENRFKDNQDLVKRTQAGARSKMRTNKKSPSPTPDNLPGTVRLLRKKPQSSDNGQPDTSNQ